MAAFAPTALRPLPPLRSRARVRCAPRRIRRTSPSRPAARAQLSGVPSGGVPLGGASEDAAHDKLLGQLMFCDPDALPGIVAARAADLDHSFFAFVDAKVAASADLEERESLRLFKAAVQDLQSHPQPPSNAASADAVAGDAAQEGDVAAYDELIDSLLAARDRDDGLRAAVVLQYARIDLRLLQRLEARAAAAADAEKNALQDVLAAITAEMQVRVDAASGRLREVLGEAGGLEAMKRHVDRFAQEGALDDAFMLLLQKNFETAVENDAKPAAEVLGILLKYATEASERKLAPELQLVRRLLRAADSAERAALLTAAFEKKGSVALPGGGMSAGVRVDGKKFVTALRGLIQEYGNVDESFVRKLSLIGEESEAVARKIYGMEDKDVRDLQEEAFHKRTVSVWDLEHVEVAEEMEGRKAGWEGQLGEIPAGFNEDRKMII